MLCVRKNNFRYCQIWWQFTHQDMCWQLWIQRNVENRGRELDDLRLYPNSLSTRFEGASWLVLCFGDKNRWRISFEDALDKIRDSVTLNQGPGIKPFDGLTVIIHISTYQSHKRWLQWLWSTFGSVMSPTLCDILLPVTLDTELCRLYESYCSAYCRFAL